MLNPEVFFSLTGCTHALVLYMRYTNIMLLYYYTVW